MDANRKGWVVDTLAPGLDLTTRLGLAQLQSRGRGCPEAGVYAGRNGATVVDCDTTVDDDGNTAVEVTVRLRSTSDPRTGLAEATSKASIGLDIDGCGWQMPVPPPQPTDLTFEATLECGDDYEVGYVIGNTPPYVSLTYTGGTTVDDLHDRLEPRLVADR